MDGPIALVASYHSVMRVVLAGLVVVAALCSAGFSAGGHSLDLQHSYLPSNGVDSASRSVVAPCHSQIRHDVLPVWMRSGFSDPKPRVPYSVGHRGAIGAVVFGWPLKSPPLANRSNKILWVPRRASKSFAALWIRLQLMEGERSVGAPIRKIIQGGPGPSIVDVPSAGCWRLTFSWSGRHDTLDLDYTSPVAN
jgi:hypothetical protein